MLKESKHTFFDYSTKKDVLKKIDMNTEMPESMYIHSTYTMCKKLHIPTAVLYASENHDGRYSHGSIVISRNHANIVIKNK